MVQVEEGTLKAESGVQTMSFYALVASLEKQKKTQAIKVSYISHKREEAADGNNDKFNITFNKYIKFKKVVQGEENAPSAKNMFMRCMDAVDKSTKIGKVFRFRFEKVGLNLKVHKPYVMTKKMIKIKKDHVVQV